MIIEVYSSSRQFLPSLVKDSLSDQASLIISLVQTTYRRIELEKQQKTVNKK